MPDAAALVRVMANDIVEAKNLEKSPLSPDEQAKVTQLVKDLCTSEKKEKEQQAEDEAKADKEKQERVAALELRRQQKQQEKEEAAEQRRLVAKEKKEAAAAQAREKKAELRKIAAETGKKPGSNKRTRTEDDDVENIDPAVSPTKPKSQKTSILPRTGDKPVGSAKNGRRSTLAPVDTEPSSSPSSPSPKGNGKDKEEKGNPDSVMSTHTGKSSLLRELLSELNIASPAKAAAMTSITR